MPRIAVEQKPGEWTDREATKEELAWLLNHNLPSQRYVDKAGVIHFFHPTHILDQDTEQPLP